MLLLTSSIITELNQLSELGNSDFGIILILCISLYVLNEKISKLLKRIKKLNNLLKKSLKYTKNKTNKR